LPDNINVGWTFGTHQLNEKTHAQFYLKSSRKKLAPSSILREAKIAYYARNMFEAGRFLFFS